MTITILGEEYRLWSSSLCISFPRSVFLPFGSKYLP
jgi:hypothetical protein